MNPISTLVFSLIFLFNICEKLSAEASFNYGYESDEIIFLKKRSRRGIDDDNNDDIDDAFRIPSDVEIKKDIIDHQYYVMEIYSNRSDMMKDYYIDVNELLKKPNSVGNKSHPILSNSYRRAVPAGIQFDFPFYGHRMRNLTIATGGFVYVGDQSHSWLAATQYIAPLMANFDTLHENSVIIYADDGEKFVVEWRNLQLREQRNDGVFTFQLSLHKNGDVWFVYKSVPISVTNISDSHHPVKMGMSDAYLFHHNIHNTDSLHSAYQNTIKRVIYEYHRIEVRPSAVVSDTIVLLKAQPTCIQYHKCDECSNATLKHFNCSWCHSKAKNGGPFCSDQVGLHRRRQQWIESNCKDNGKITYCDPNEDFIEIEDADEDFSTTDTKLQPTTVPMEPDQVVPWEKNKSSEAQAEDGSKEMERKPKQGYVYLFIVITGVTMVICWVTYAYYNPHTSSGQFLIRYRPSRWHIPSSHVRYSASVHM